MDEKQKKVYDKIGLLAYSEIKKALEMAEDAKTLTPNKKIFQVTKNNKQLENKEYIKTLYPNLNIMTEQEWIKYAYEHLTPEEQKKVKRRIIEEINGEKRI
jgi:hypothetical protein